MDEFQRMRSYIMVAQLLGEEEAIADEPLIEDITPSIQTSLLEDLEHIIFKLRAFTESDTEHAFGVELGMQRAADMIENALRRHDREG